MTTKQRVQFKLGDHVQLVEANHDHVYVIVKVDAMSELPRYELGDPEYFSTQWFDQTDLKPAPDSRDAQIAALKAEVEALRAALKPFAEFAEEVTNTTAFPRDANVVYGYNDHELTVSDFKRAAKALNTTAS